MNNEKFATSTNYNYFLEAEGLTKHFPAGERTSARIHAADDISFKVPKGMTLGVVGESGCGKSTVGKMLLDIHHPDSGRIIYEGTDITDLKGKERFPYMKKMQMVWQDPYSSLDPRMRARDIIMEPMKNFGIGKNEAERLEKTYELLRMCGLYPEDADKYAYQFSGGQRQRICIARALATEPEFIVCDEAVSALDVSIQAQIVNLLMDLQEELKLTYLFISHDLNIVRFISDEIIVMYLGQIVERSTTEALFANRAHPYTRALFSAMPQIGDTGETEVLQGDVASPVDPPAGCRFASRCPYASDLCAQEPGWHKVEENHFVKCHLYDDLPSL